MQLGLLDALSGTQCVIVEGIVSGPVDAVLFDMDQPDCAAVARYLQARHGCANVIACSSLRPVMRIFGPGKPSPERPLTVAALAMALMPRAPPRRKRLRRRPR
jgi:hypothetical protein